MARIQNERDASEDLNFRTLKVDGKVRNPTIKEEFVQVIKEFKIPVKKVFIDSISEEYFSKTSKMAKVLGYLNVMYKYAGKEIDAIPDSVFRFWDQNDLKKRLFSMYGKKFVFSQILSISFKT